MDKIKVYLDTNQIQDLFVNQALALKRREEAETPEKLKFFLENRERIEFITSVATEAEIARELIAGYGLTDDQFETLWSGFMEKLKCRYIEEFNVDKRFSQLPKRIRIKLRTFVNFIHVFIAMKEDAYLVTGDKDLIRICSDHKIYDKVISYIELRKLIASLYEHS